ncbi:MAG TPA: Asp-tRNA(Asn)/Glu-tRNA(Gln) amidotransferase subunit GatB [Actinomycetota bacterium]|nr:Asp-tRNA(Asn)/Glu-tRNA(Gln) amidotransferase subunit GatB [Actinomycetota bacterium]
MDLQRRKLWSDRATWVVAFAALGYIVYRNIRFPSDFIEIVLYVFGALVVAAFAFSELRVGRRRPAPGPRSSFAGSAAYVGAAGGGDGGPRRTESAAVPGVMEIEPFGLVWRARSAPPSGPHELRVPWRDLYSWRLQGVIPGIGRANGYLTVRTADERTTVFHVWHTKRWRTELAEAAVALPTYQRPDWLPDEAGAEFPALLADHIDPDGPASPRVLGEIARPPYRAQEPAPRKPAPVREPEAPAEPEPAPEPEPAREPEPEPEPATEPAPDPEPAREPEPEPEPARTEPASEPPTEEEQQTMTVTAPAETTYEAVIGLECHVELSTDSKVFCACPTTFGAEPNTQICEVCTGQPGTLPVINERAVEYAIRIGLALNCEIAPRSVFHRKNYFYPDMPKNYQISQYDIPLASRGWLEVEVDGETRRIGVHRVHLEEDTGKTSHVGGSGRIGDAEYAKVDYNRAGVPLVEIVSEPDIRSPEEARAYLTELRALLQAIEVSDVRMEEGSLRCDANVSIRPVGETALGTKAEVKNMNSIRSVQRALAHEIERQTELVGSGGRVVQETRHFDEASGRTLPGRSKEGSEDYRYFPDPDLVPLAPSREWVDRVRTSLPELPSQRRRRLVEEHALSERDARTLTATKALADAYESAVAAYPGDPRSIARWYIGELSAMANERGVEPHEAGVGPEQVVALQTLVDEERISISVAKGTVLRAVAETGADPATVVAEQGLAQISGSEELTGVVDEVIADSAKLVDQIRSGKLGAVNALVGQVMKRTQGRANPEVVRSLISERLGL